MQTEDQQLEGANGEEIKGVGQGLTPTSDMFGDSPLFSEGETVIFKDLSSCLKQLGDKTLFLQWYNASEYPKLEPILKSPKLS
jgi:hypothetical protein